MGHCHVDQLGDEIPWCRLANQKPDLIESIRNPRKQNEQCDANGADGIQIPHESVSDNRHDQAKAVDNNVIAVIDLLRISLFSRTHPHKWEGWAYEEDMHRGVLSVCEAVHHQGALGKYGDADDNDGHNVQLFRGPLTLAKGAA